VEARTPRAYDSDPLNEQLRRNGIEMIPLKPHQAREPRWAAIQTTRQTVAGRTLLRLAPVAAPRTCALGILPTEFHRLCLTRLPRNPLQAILR
jgi:hypothetical protein